MSDIEIIINIPKDVYYDVLQYVELNVNTEFENLMINAIKNGNPLPKEHGKLITEPTEEEITETIGGKNDFADCIREAVKTVFANATPIIEADKAESEEDK